MADSTRIDVAAAEEARDPLWVIRAGIVPYDEAVALQERIHQARLDGQVPDVLLLLEHPPVITLGRGTQREHLLATPERLERLGVQLRETARGGDVTYHGPGQLVGYPIFHLDRHGRDVHRFLRGVEEALIEALRRLAVTADRVAGLTGVWAGSEKIAAIGIGVRRWVTWHGFALNISTDLDSFQLIVPCGIREYGVTSLEQLLSHRISEDDVAAAVTAGFVQVFNLRAEPRELGELLREMQEASNVKPQRSRPSIGESDV